VGSNEAYFFILVGAAPAKNRLKDDLLNKERNLFHKKEINVYKSSTGH
jgi:hypothetical protein